MPEIINKVTRKCLGSRHTFLINPVRVSQRKKITKETRRYFEINDNGNIYPNLTDDVHRGRLQPNLHLLEKNRGWKSKEENKWKKKERKKINGGKKVK